mgnify:CR=1 FL=1
MVIVPIVYSGLGILVPFTAIGEYMGTMMAMDSMFGPDFINDNEWAKAIPLFGTGVMLLFAGIVVNRILVGKDQRGQNPDSRYRHTLFGFPIEYWSFFPLGLSVVAFIKGVSGN